MSISYSKSAKKSLLESAEKKKKCCERMLSDMLSLESVTESSKRAELIRTATEHFKCGFCFAYFLRGLFIVFGNVTDPEKRYHLELSFESSEERECVLEILFENGVDMKSCERKNRFLLYLKDSSQIEDFFAVIGANKLAFDLMNSKILREVRGDANRQMNCDMANIKKSLSAAGKHIEMIAYLNDSGAIIRLPSDLRETARLRYENTQASLADLGHLHNPPISKSGVKHRLDKIADFYEEIISKN